MDEEAKKQTGESEAIGESTEASEAIDWKAQARKWEKLAKKNRAAEDELEQLRQTHAAELGEIKSTAAKELADAVARAERAEAAVKELQDRADREQTIREISETTGTPAELLEYCADAEAMEDMARKYSEAGLRRIPSAAPASFSRIVRDDFPPQTPREIFADWARENLR